MNSFVLCLFLCIVVASILARTLKNDLEKYAASEADELESLERADDSGWKQIHGDVFRRPQHLMLFSVLHGTGCHIGALCITVLFLASANSYYSKRGMTATAAVSSYVATQIVNGWSGGHLFKLYGGKGWKRALIHQVAFLPMLLFVTFAVVNTTAVLYGSSIALPFGKVVILLAMFFLLCIPLHAMGTVIGRRQSMRTSIPCRVHQLKRPIPMKSPFFFALHGTSGRLGTVRLRLHRDAFHFFISLECEGLLRLQLLNCSAHLGSVCYGMCKHYLRLHPSEFRRFSMGMGCFFEQCFFGRLRLLVRRLLLPLFDDDWISTDPLLLCNIDFPLLLLRDVERIFGVFRGISICVAYLSHLPI